MPTYRFARDPNTPTKPIPLETSHTHPTRDLLVPQDAAEETLGRRDSAQAAQRELADLRAEREALRKRLQKALDDIAAAGKADEAGRSGSLLA